MTTGYVGVVDLATRTLIDAIPAGSPATFAIAISPDGTKAFAVNNTDASVIPITIATDTAGAAIPVGGANAGTQVRAICVLPDSSKAYAVCAGSPNLYPIDVVTDVVGAPIASGGDNIAVNPSGTTLFVAYNSAVGCSPVNVASSVVGSFFSIGSGGGGPVQIAPDGLTGWEVGAYGANATLYSFDVGSETGGSSAVIGSGFSLVDIAITPDGFTAYLVANAGFGAGAVYPVDLGTLVVGTPIPVGSYPFGIAISPDGATAYVCNALSGTVTPIDTATNTAGTPVAVGGNPISVAITPDGTKAYVCNTGTPAPSASPAWVLGHVTFGGS